MGWIPREHVGLYLKSTVCCFGWMRKCKLKEYEKWMLIKITLSSTSKCSCWHQNVLRAEESSVKYLKVTYELHDFYSCVMADITVARVCFPLLMSMKRVYTVKILCHPFSKRNVQSFHFWWISVFTWRRSIRRNDTAAGGWWCWKYRDPGMTYHLQLHVGQLDPCVLLCFPDTWWLEYGAGFGLPSFSTISTRCYVKQKKESM